MGHDTGGDAFPSHGSMGERVETGMTLRDYFAAKAVASLIVAQVAHAGAFTPDKNAKIAYAIADAMIAERAK